MWAQRQAELNAEDYFFGVLGQIFKAALLLCLVTIAAVWAGVPWYWAVGIGLACATAYLSIGIGRFVDN